VTIDGRSVRHRVLSSAVAAVVLCLGAACGSSGSSGSSAGSATGGDPGKASTSYPKQDVVSTIAVDQKLSAELPAAVRTQRSITLGTTLTPGTAGLPHGGIAANGQAIGLDIDLRNAVAKLLGVRWKVQNGTFATIIPGVQNGKYDVGQDNFGVTKAREQVVDFATYLTDGQSFLAPRDSKLDKVTKITDLCGLAIATSPGTTFQQILTSDAAKCTAAGKKPYKVSLFADTAPIFLGLANGKVDIYFGPTLGLKYDATHVPDVKFLGQFSSTPVGFVTAKGSPLAKAISDAVNTLVTDGGYAKILAKWGVTSSGIPKSQVNPSATL
jgi:polar amino acid transport system substrate-binding protein